MAERSVLLLRDVPEEQRHSMERYADELESALVARGGLAVRSMAIHESRVGGRLGLPRLDSYLTRFVRYPIAAARERADVYHVVDHGYGQLALLLPKARTVISCHDLMLLVAAEIDMGARADDKTLVRFRWAVSYLRKVARVVCNSRTTQSDVVRLLGIPPERTAIVPYGLNPGFRPLDETERERVRAGFQRRSGEHLLAHVSTGIFYKNVATTLRVLAGLRDAGIAARLVRAGTPLTPEEEELAAELRVEDLVTELGFLDDAELRELYGAADALLFPSFYEGFGWPVLEAMACGAPVVASTAPALAELVEGVGLVAPATDVAGLVRHVRAVLEQPGLAERFRAAGLAHAATFTWSAAAAAVAEIYEEVAEGAGIIAPLDQAPAGRHGTKRSDRDSLAAVQEANRRWWEDTPMNYDWRAGRRDAELTLEWFDEQDRKSAETHALFATDRVPFDRLIPYDELRGKRVLEIGVGAGFHSELLARAGAELTGIDLTDAAISRTEQRFRLKGLEGRFERWDAEEDRADFRRAFDYVWSWGVIHHSARTARIVRNVEDWLADGGAFGGMVYHRDSTSAAAALVRDWLLRGKLFSQSLDETLWRNTDGFSARFYPAEQWRDLLLGFFAEASVVVAGNDVDVLPLPGALRRRLLPHVSAERRADILRRRGSFVTFRATAPLRREG